MNSSAMLGLDNSCSHSCYFLRSNREGHMEVSTELPTCGEQGLNTKRTRFVFLLTGRIQDDNLQAAHGLGTDHQACPRFMLVEQSLQEGDVSLFLRVFTLGRCVVSVGKTSLLVRWLSLSPMVETLSRSYSHSLPSLMLSRCRSNSSLARCLDARGGGSC
jgi:hypothetical protein